MLNPYLRYLLWPKRIERYQIIRIYKSYLEQARESPLGPIIIFDKSVLHSLNVDESVLFDNFFLSNIVPIFFVETLADLEKAAKPGRSPEQEVGLLATKTPQLHAYPNRFHLEICTANLLGYEVAMDGRPIIAGGKPVKTPDQTGMVYDESPEARTLSRWQTFQFSSAERQIAWNWRTMIATMSFRKTVGYLNSIGIKPKKCQSLSQAKQIAEAVVNLTSQSLSQMQFALSLLGVPRHYYKRIVDRWYNVSRPTITEFAPYAAYVLTIEIFFYVATAAKLFSTAKVTNKIDLAYLYYLPFCMVFTSADHFHRRSAPLFLRSKQKFVWGPELKADLKKLDQFYDKLPEVDREKGLYHFASHPPDKEDFLITHLWDQLLPRWRSSMRASVPRSDESDKHLITHFKRFANAEPLKADQVDFDLSNPDAIVFKRRVQKRRGKYWQVSRDPEPDD